MKNKKKLNIGITGSSGFIGSALFEHFKNAGDNIIALDDLVFPEAKKVKIVIPGTLDWVLHFGATKTIEASFENPMDIYRRNMHSTMAALEIATSKKSKFLYMSSYVYGKPRYLPIDEKHPTSVINPYMGSKLLGEQMCCQLHQCMGLSVMILRGFTLYGPKQKDDQLIPSIVESIRNNRRIIVKDPNPKRDYLYISDFVRLIDIIVHSGYSGIEIYNVGGGKLHKNIEVARMANKLAGNPVRIHVVGKVRKNDITQCYANIKKVKKDFKWQPEVSLAAGITKCLFI